MLAHPELIRNVALVGNLHHGKSSFMDMLIRQTHMMGETTADVQRYTDIMPMERQRGMSIKSAPMSFLLPNIKEKSHVVHIIDTPGHIDFIDETVAALRLCDGMVIVMDVIEGVTIYTERLLQIAAKENLSIVLVLNKMDRLIVELKLPPNDAYFKLKHVLEDFNACVATHLPGSQQLYFSPILGNVCFASSQMEWCFSLRSFASIYYSRIHGGNAAAVDDDVIEAFSKRLWGDVYFDQTSRRFFSKKKAGEEDKKTMGKRTFVEFILEPLYKIYAHVMGESGETLSQCLNELNIRLKKTQYQMNVKPLLRVVLKQFLGNVQSFSDMLLNHVPSPINHARSKLERIYRGPLLNDDEVALAMTTCSSRGPLRIHVSKLYVSEDGKRFDALGRVMSGTVRVGQRVKVLGEHYSLEDEEDMNVCEVTKLWLPEARYRIELQQASAGNWVLMEGVDESIMKTATIVDEEGTYEQQPYHTFIPLQFPTRAVVRVGVEPLNPSELPKMLEGLRKLTKSYPIFSMKVEESGEHMMLGTGEMYLDCVLYELRTIHTEMEIKVADPVVTFSETVVETSSIKCVAETPNKKNTLAMLAEPLEKGLAEDIEQGFVATTVAAAVASSASDSKKTLAEFFQKKYHWDLLQSRQIWAFGPEDTNGPNVLVDDTLLLPSSEMGKGRVPLHLYVSDSIRQGFQWATREGPLCEEPMRNVKFRLVDATISSDPISRGGGQIIPTARRVCYSAFLTATPRLMEPMYVVEIHTPAESVSTIYTLLARRRGHVTQDIPKAGTPLSLVKALLPVIESFGFETDLRVYTQGRAFCQQLFDHWQMTPGDPLDMSVVVRSLEPSPTPHLARDFMIKTRRRKGLSEDVVITKYFDDSMLLSFSTER
jgi:U5 small nuclear ribonucleoprotein component